MAKSVDDRFDEVARHKVNNYLTELWFNVWTFTTTIDYMKQEIWEVKTLLKEFIEKSEQKFATKTEHYSNSERLKRVENSIIWVVVVFITGIIWAILKLVLIG